MTHMSFSIYPDRDADESEADETDEDERSGHIVFIESRTRRK
jgi:hypothetical protein